MIDCPIADQQDRILADKDAFDKRMAERYAQCEEMVNDPSSDFYYLRPENIAEAIVIDNWLLANLDESIVNCAMVELSELQQYIRINDDAGAFNMMKRLSKSLCLLKAQRYLRVTKSYG